MEISVYKTMDYDRFRLINGNREIRDYRKIMKSIKERDLTPYRPIWVNSRFEIIDGQNRYMACKMLNKPIYYQVVDVDDEDIIAAIAQVNSAQTMWRLHDYVNMYAKTGVKCYRDLLEFMKERSIQPHQVTIAMIVYTGNTDRSYKRFIKNGNPFEKWSSANEVWDILVNLNVPYKLHSIFVASFIDFYKTHTGKQVDKLAQNLIQIPMLASESAYAIAFDNVINTRKKRKQ